MSIGSALPMVLMGLLQALVALLVSLVTLPLLGTTLGWMSAAALASLIVSLALLALMGSKWVDAADKALDSIDTSL